MGPERKPALLDLLPTIHKHGDGEVGETQTSALCSHLYIPEAGQGGRSDSARDVSQDPPRQGKALTAASSLLSSVKETLQGPD